MLGRAARSLAQHGQHRAVIRWKLALGTANAGAFKLLRIDGCADWLEVVGPQIQTVDPVHRQRFAGFWLKPGQRRPGDAREFESRGMHGAESIREAGLLKGEG